MPISTWTMHKNDVVYASACERDWKLLKSKWRRLGQLWHRNAHMRGRLCRSGSWTWCLWNHSHIRGCYTEAIAICAHVTLQRHLPSNYLFDSGLVPHFAINHSENNSHFKILATVSSHFVFADFLSCHWHDIALKYTCHQLNNPILIPMTHRVEDKDWLLNLFSDFYMCALWPACVHTQICTHKCNK